MDSNWAYDQPESLFGSAQHYLKILLDRSEICFDSLSVSSPLDVPEDWMSYRVGENGNKFQESILPTLVEGVLGFGAIRRCLFHEDQFWTLEDLAGRGRWYVAVLAHCDQDFKQALQMFVRSFRSNFNARNNSSVDNLLESTLDINDVIREVKNAIIEDRSLFMNTLARHGKPTMLAPFLDANIELDEDRVPDNCLGAAAGAVNLETFEMLLRAGPSAARAIPTLCKSRHISSQAFRELLSKLVDRLKPTKNRALLPDGQDPLITIIRANKALQAQAHAVEALLRNKIFHSPGLQESKNVHFTDSYVFWAISCNRATILKLLLEHIPPLDLTNSSMFFHAKCNHARLISNYNWLTLAVDLGRAECVKIILDHMEDQKQAINCTDGLGRTALDIAQTSVKASHPRKSVLVALGLIVNKRDSLISVSEDEATLLVLQMAAGTEAVTKHPAEDSIHEPSSWSPYISNIFCQVNNIQTSVINHMGELLLFPPKGLSYNDVAPNCPHSSCSARRKKHAQDLARERLEQLNGMAFFEALIVRLCYITMIGLIIVYELAALAIGLRGLGKLSRPSRIVTLVVLIFVMWVSKVQVRSDPA